MWTTADCISDQLGKVDWKKVGIAVVATGAAIGVGVLTGGVGIAAVGALGLTEETLGAVIVGGAVKNVIKGSSSSPKPGHITEVAKQNLADIGNKSEPQLDLGNSDPYELLKKRGIPTILSDEERAASDAYGLVAKAEGKTYQTYIKENTATGEKYAGRTSGTGTPLENIAKRDKNHHMNSKGYEKAILDKSSTNKAAIREREQELIDQLGGAKSEGGTSENAIRGISKNNPKLELYMREAEKEFGK